MVTILKFPIYIQVESDSTDRSRISQISREILYPHLLEYLASAKIKSKVLGEISREIGNPISVSFLTEIDLIHKAVSREVPLVNKLEIV